VRRPGRLLVLALAVAAAWAAALPARDAEGPPRPDAARERRDRRRQYLAAFRRLSPAARERARQLDRALQAEDPATRARLFAVMERYAGWLSRLPESDRRRVEAVPAGPDRLRVVRELLDQQWRDGLPPTRREQLAKAADPERTKLAEKWRREERDRAQERDRALRFAEEMAQPGFAAKMAQFRDDVQKFVKADLEPKLTANEKKRLAMAASKAPAAYAYYHQVWVLSEAKGLKPPGPPEVWARFREQRKPVRLPE
jgi:hypothetical protein